MSHPSADSYDVIVVGAGPAGSVAACELGNEFDVLLIDRGDLPQNKPCGGLLCEESIEIVKDWEGVGQSLTSPSCVKLGYLDFDNRKTIRTDREFWNIDRRTFSSWLLNRLPKRVTVLPRSVLRDVDITGDGVEVVIEGESSRRLRARYLIGADGTTSTVRRAVSHAPTRRSALYQVLVEGGSEQVRDRTWFVFDSSITRHYAWVIPKEGHTLVGTTLDGKDKGIIDTLVAKVAAELKTSTRVLASEAHPATLIDSPEELVPGAGNILLVGEAAGFISPSSFEGISYALESALAVAQAIRAQPASPVDAYRHLCEPIYRRLAGQVDKSRVVFDKENRGKYWSSLSDA